MLEFRKAEVFRALRCGGSSAKVARRPAWAGDERFANGLEAEQVEHAHIGPHGRDGKFGFYLV